MERKLLGRGCDRCDSGTVSEYFYTTVTATAAVRIGKSWK
jgi:hypothetical protein